MYTVSLDCQGSNVTFFGKVKGSNTNKFHRATKLLSMYNSLSEKMDGYINRGMGFASPSLRAALCVKMMMYTGIRIGNESSAEGYITKPHPNSKAEPKFVQTFGLTTIKREHVMFKRGKCYLNFLGKKQVENSFVICDKTLVQQLKYLWDANLPTDTFFATSVSDLTKFIKRSVGKQFTPKDFRTMRANIFAWEAYEMLPKKKPQFKKDLNAEIKSVATYVSEKLNNTPGVCKKSYIDELFFEYLENTRYYI